MNKFTTETGLEYVMIGDKVVVKGAIKTGSRVLKFRDSIEATAYMNVERWLWGITSEVML